MLFRSKAVNHFKKALKLDQTSMETYISLGNVLLTQGSIKQAELCFRKTKSFGLLYNLLKQEGRIYECDKISKLISENFAFEGNEANWILNESHSDVSEIISDDSDYYIGNM